MNVIGKVNNNNNNNRKKLYIKDSKIMERKQSLNLESS